MPTFVAAMAALLTLSGVASGVKPPSLCRRVSEAEPAGVRHVGCVSEALVPRNGTYEVEFSDGVADAKEADACWRTCDTVYANSSMALVRWIVADGRLDCLCTVGDVIDATVVGPDVFCDTECQNSEACGGAHTFQSGVTVSYFSIYCIPRAISGNASATTREQENEHRIDTTREIVKVGNIYTEDENLDEKARTQRDIETILNDIYILMSKTNIVSVVAIGLMLIVIILVLILLVWAYVFIENFDPNVSPSLFYRRLSHPRRGQAVNGGNQRPPHSVYGSTNKAFDPTPDTPPPPAALTPSVHTFSTPMGEHVGVNGGRKKNAGKSEDALSAGKPGSDPTAAAATDHVSSTFYGGELRNTLAELRSSQESIETEMADDPAPMDDVEEDNGVDGVGDSTNDKSK